jgi:vesicle-fusing ATPase
VFRFTLTVVPQVQMEIGLPNENGRFQILSIHTGRMKEYKKINPDVDIKVKQLIF